MAATVLQAGNAGLEVQFIVGHEHLPRFDLVKAGYGLDGLQQRAELFIAPGDEVYEGMVVGENSRDNDLDGAVDVVVPCLDGTLEVIDSSEASLPGWPQTMTSSVGTSFNWAAPTVGDIDGDDLLEMAVVTRAGYLFVYETEGAASSKVGVETLTRNSSPSGLPSASNRRAYTPSLLASWLRLCHTATRVPSSASAMSENDWSSVSNWSSLNCLVAGEPSASNRRA